MLPSFVIGGAQKAGTTSLHWRLKSHPDVFIPDKPQEIHFFDDARNFARGLSWYEGLFAGWSGEAQVGQTSPRYLYDPEAPGRIHTALPQVRLIFLLRNPVDRAYSHYWHSVKLGYETLSFEEALEREEERLASGGSSPRDHSYADRGRYAEQLARYLALFPKRQVLVLTGPPSGDETEERVARFLSLDAGRFPPRRQSAKQSNPSRLPRIHLIQRLTRHVRDRLPYVTAAVDLLNLRTAEYPPMAPTTRERLLERFDAEIASLEELLETDLSHWRR